MEKIWTFEEIDAHLDKHQAQLSSATSLKAAPTSSQLCEIYKGVKPILEVVSKLPFIPQKWRDAITTFISVLNALCP